MFQKTFSPLVLYRGGCKAIEVGDVIERRPPEIADKFGNKVYASPLFEFAALFGIMQRVPASIFGGIVCGQDFYSYLIMTLDFKNEFPFEKIMEKNAYVARVPPETFTPFTPVLSSGISFEYASKETVKALSVSVIRNDDFIRNRSVQIFSTDFNTFKKLNALNRNITPDEIGGLVCQGALKWENEREEYDDAPKARPDNLIRLFGFKHPVRSNIRLGQTPSHVQEHGKR